MAFTLLDPSVSRSPDLANRFSSSDNFFASSSFCFTLWPPGLFGPRTMQKRRIESSKKLACGLFSSSTLSESIFTKTMSHSGRLNLACTRSANGETITACLSVEYQFHCPSCDTQVLYTDELLQTGVCPNPKCSAKLGPEQEQEIRDGLVKIRKELE